MTAINIFRQRYRVSILTDAAGYDAEGVVAGFYPKCIPLPHLRAAVASRGTALATAVIAANLGFRFQTFDDMVGEGADFVREVIENAGDLLCSPEQEIDLFLAGWSESNNRPESYFLISDDRQGLEPWTFQECDPTFGAPIPSEQAVAAQQLDLTKRAEQVDPVGDGIKLLKAQRQEKHNVLANGTGFAHVVGGFALLTEIKSDGISQRVIHRWEEDKIGEVIWPYQTEAEGKVVDLTSMTRQQRRLVEREARKSRAHA